MSGVVTVVGLSVIKCTERVVAAGGLGPGRRVVEAVGGDGMRVGVGREGRRNDLIRNGGPCTAARTICYYNRGPKANWTRATKKWTRDPCQAAIHGHFLPHSFVKPYHRTAQPRTRTSSRLLPPWESCPSLVGNRRRPRLVLSLVAPCDTVEL